MSAARARPDARSSRPRCATRTLASCARAWARPARASPRRGRSRSTRGRVAIAGLCAGVDPSLRPGDVICANELRREDGTTGRRPGRRRARCDRSAATACAAHVGPVVSTDRILTPGRARRSSTARSRSTWSRRGSPRAPAGGRSPCSGSSPTAQAAGSDRPAHAHSTALRALARPAPLQLRPLRVGARGAVVRRTNLTRPSPSDCVTPMSVPLRRASPSAKVPRCAQRLRQERQVPAARRARAALPVQPRVLVLREDPVPGAHPQEADAGRPGARRDRGVRARRWSRSRAASRSSTPRCT